MLMVLRRLGGAATSTEHRTAERASRARLFFSGCDVCDQCGVRLVTWGGSGAERRRFAMKQREPHRSTYSSY